MPYFKRKDVRDAIGLTNAGASKFIAKLLSIGIIEPISGHGKGAYVFGKGLA